MNVWKPKRVEESMKIVAAVSAMILFAGTAFGMVGGPIFCVGEKMTAMTVEASRITMHTVSPSGSGSQAATMDRMYLTARYGVMSNVDLGASLGTSNLGFSDLYGGYSDYRSGWSVAWGASVRAGYPFEATPYQVVGILQYNGFQPKGSSSNGLETVSSKYVWHEMAVTVAGGWRVGPVIPYAGLTKPYLFGKRDIRVSMRGREFPAAGGYSNYSDGEQPLRGVLGLDWKLPEGYSLTAEGTSTSGGVWTVSVGVAQVLK